MYGILTTFIKGHGKRFLRLLIVCIIFLIAVRGCDRIADLAVEKMLPNGLHSEFSYELINDYEILHRSAKWIVLCKKVEWVGTDGKLQTRLDPNVINGGTAFGTAWIKEYQISDPYILICGKLIKGEIATEDELKKENADAYFLVNAYSDEVFGPFKNRDEFVEYCQKNNIAYGEWIKSSSVFSLQ